MSGIVSLVIRRPITFLMVFVLLIILSFYTIPNIPVDLLPEVEKKILVVVVNYDGIDATPRQVETIIARPFEAAIATISGIKEMTTYVRASGATIVLELEKPISEVKEDVRDVVERAARGVDNILKPLLREYDPISDQPIMVLYIKNNRDIETITAIAKDYLIPQLERVDGVASIDIQGGQLREVRIELRQEALQAYNITLSTIQNAVSSQNLTLGSGQISAPQEVVYVRALSDFQTLEEIQNIVVRSIEVNGVTRSVYLKDIAEVTWTAEEPSSAVYLDGVQALGLSFSKQSGKNTVQTISRLKKAFRTVFATQNLEYGIVSDASKPIVDAINQVLSSMLSGALLAVIILLLFLRNIRATIVISISIPISVFLTLMTMYFSGLSLNLMSLTGLVLGIGMLVDNAVVILENIYRYRERGTSIFTSSLLGAQEMFAPIVASTLTSVVVFLPLILFKSQMGVIGDFFYSLAFTVVISLLVSLFSAVFLIPVLSSYFIPIYTEKQRPLTGIKGKISHFLSHIIVAIENFYERLLIRVLRHRIWVIIGVTATLILSFFLFQVPGFQFVPNFSSKQFGGKIGIWEPGNFQKRQQILLEFQTRALKELKENNIEMNYVYVNFRGGSSDVYGEFKADKGVRENNDKFEEIMRNIARSYQDRGMKVYYTAQGPPSSGGTNASIDIELSGEDVDALEAAYTRMVYLLNTEVEEVKDISEDEEDKLNEFRLIFDREKLARQGLDFGSVLLELQNYFSGVKIGKFRAEGTEYDINLILNREDREDIDLISKIFFMNKNGDRVALSDIVELGEGKAESSIRRVNRKRIKNLTGDLMPKATLLESVRKVQSIFSERLILPEGVFYAFKGQYEDLNTNFISLILIFILAILLVFGIMASQFESFTEPFMILFSIPLLFIGVVAVHIMTMTPITTFTGIGIIMLAGIIVNNGIVLVDYANLLRLRGVSGNMVVIQAGKARLRAILITSITTIVGLLPMVFMKSDSGFSLVQPIGLAVLGGLSVGTLITLIFIPVLYSLIYLRTDKKNKKQQQEDAQLRAAIKEMDREEK